MDTYKCNYHMHSCYSDGALTPAQLVRKFVDEEYDIIALTDHDGIGGVKEFLAACEAAKVQGVAGVEFSTSHEFKGKNLEIHLLGYRFDPDNEELIEATELLKKRRHDRNVKLLAKLNEMGYEMNLEELESQSKGKYVGKPNIARLMTEKGYVSSPREAFDKILETPEIRSIRKEKMTTEEAIGLVLRAGGQPFVAHPGKIRDLGERESEEFWSNFEELLKELKKAGLKGLECIYPAHSENEEYRFIQLAGKYHLHISSGTDYHSDDL
jgi:predicted metal-dependent phosphoesterase TrpH